jgi:hypothetical protein
VDIAWAHRAVVNGTTNLIDVDDHVRVRATQADGTVNGATADKLQAKLAPKPTTQASTTAPTTTASTKPSEADKMNFMAGKEITTATLSGNVKVKSELLAADGTLARGLDLLSETVVYNRATGRMEVPVAGQMLYQDHRAPQPQQAAAAAPEGPTVGSGRGATAFQWNRSLVYDQLAREAVMTGDVQVVHKPDSNGGQPFNLNGQTLTAYLEPDPAAATKPAKPTQPAQPAKTASTKPSSSFFGDDTTSQQKFRLKRITVRDNVHVTSNRMNFDAHDLSYDPLAQVLTASGDEANPVIVFDNKDGSTTTASELEWNTKTDQFKVKRLGGKVRR